MSKVPRRNPTPATSTVVHDTGEAVVVAPDFVTAPYKGMDFYGVPAMEVPPVTGGNYGSGGPFGIVSVPWSFPAGAGSESPPMLMQIDRYGDGTTWKDETDSDDGMALLWATFTSKGRAHSDYVSSLGEPDPIIVLLPGQEANVGGILKASFIEGAYGPGISYDATSQRYHLSYYVLAYTNEDHENDLGPGSSLLPFAARYYDADKEASFSRGDFWVISNWGAALSPGTKAKRLLMHAVGRRVEGMAIFRDETPPTYTSIFRPYLVFDCPRVVSAWDGSFNESADVRIVRVSGSASGGFYTGHTQDYDASANTWSDDDEVFVVDANP